MQKVGGQSPPPFGRVSGALGAAQTPVDPSQLENYLPKDSHAIVQRRLWENLRTVLCGVQVPEHHRTVSGPATVPTSPPPPRGGDEEGGPRAGSALNQLRPSLPPWVPEGSLAGVCLRHEMALELVCRADFWCNRHCRTSPVDLEGFWGQVWPKICRTTARKFSARLPSGTQTAVPTPPTTWLGRLQPTHQARLRHSKLSLSSDSLETRLGANTWLHFGWL